VALLSAEALGLGDGDAFDADLVKGLIIASIFFMR